MAEARLEIPGYSIEREIGRGGMARVYLAVQKKFGRLVAIKVVSPEYTADPSFGKRFVREARIIAQLSHPNIVQVHDAGVNDQCYYLVMEYLRGGDLNRRLKRGLHMQAAISVVKDIARGLDSAHAKGFVHRDIKPENILFREDGSAVLSDFGVARVISSGASITQHGTVVGTPQYMSPEQAAGRAARRTLRHLQPRRGVLPHADRRSAVQGGFRGSCRHPPSAGSDSAAARASERDANRRRQDSSLKNRKRDFRPAPK